MLQNNQYISVISYDSHWLIQGHKLLSSLHNQRISIIFSLNVLKNVYLTVSRIWKGLEVEAGCRYIMFI